jgi:flagellar biosynthesis protein FliP
MMRRSCAVAIGAIVLLLPFAAAAQTAPLDLLDQQGGDLSRTIVQLLALITVLAVVPGLLVMVTSFTKFVVVFSVLRSALGLQQSPPNLVIIGLSLFLTFFVMQPTFERAWEDGIGPYLEGSVPASSALEGTVGPFRSFMAANVREKDLVLFEELARERPSAAAGKAGDRDEAEDQLALMTLIPAFLTSELRKAFTIAFLLFVPFLVIEMIVSSILMAMGMMMLPPVIISLPFKLIFFVLVDGWWLLGGSLVRSYN